MSNKSSKHSSKASTTKSSAKKSGPSVLPFSAGGFKGSEDFQNKAQEQYKRATSDASDMGRQGWEAVQQSFSVLTQGMEQWVQTCTTMVQDSGARNTEAMKELMACKSLSEVTEMQNRLAQDGFSEMMQNVAKLSEIGVRLATDAFEPMTSQMNNSMHKTAA